MKDLGKFFLEELKNGHKSAPKKWESIFVWFQASTGRYWHQMQQRESYSSFYPFAKSQIYSWAILRVLSLLVKRTDKIRLSRYSPLEIGPHSLRRFIWPLISIQDTPMKCVASEISHKQSEVANIRLQPFNTYERFRQVDQRTLHKLSTHVQTYYTGPFGHLKRSLTTRGFRCQIVQHITVEHL